MKSLVILVVAAVGTLAAPSNRITNAENAAAWKYPYQISLHWGQNGQLRHICGGSIIAPQWILTAGHCITEVPKGDMLVKAGLMRQSEEAEQAIKVVQTIVHPEYLGGVNPNDVALLKLETPLEYSEHVQPINLPQPGAIPMGLSDFTGWGSISMTTDPIVPDHMQYAQLKAISFEECQDDLISIMGTSEPLVDTNVCTKGLNQVSACSGDSGGPLVQNGEVIGIASWAVLPCGVTPAPSVFTRVSAFIDFIQENSQ